MNRLVVLAVLAACEQPRTQLMVGVVTDVKAPNVIDSAQLVVTRAKDGFVEQQVQWDISGVANMPFNLPGSYGIYSDGEEIQLDLVLTGMKNGGKVVDRRAVLNLIEGKTLFFRMSLTAGCIARTDCLPTQSCVEGVCRDVNADARQFPTFSDDLVGQLTCNSGTSFLDTATGAPLPFSATADQCPANLCLEGTCLNPPPEERGTRLVSGTQFKNFVQTGKSSNVPDDLNALAPQVLVPHADGTFTTIDGTGRTDGTFTINDVPDAKYYLKIGTRYYVTHASHFDLTRSILGRPDAAVPAAPATTGITLNLTGLQAWQPGDALEAFAADANTWWFDLQGIVAITNTATQLTNYTFTLQNALDTTGDGNLIKNDAFVVMQLRSGMTADGIPFVTPSRIFIPPGAVTMMNGMTTTLNGAFTPVTPSSTLTATLRTTLFDSAIGWNGTNMTALNPRSVDFESLFPGSGNYGLNVLGQAGGSQHGEISATADYLLAHIPHGADRTLSNLSFAIPTLPGEWATIVDIRQGGQVLLQLPNTTSPARLNVGISQSTLLGSEGPGFYAPLIGPPRAPTIDGRDLFVDQTISATPTIFWQVPDVGKPTQYQVTVQHLTNVNNRTVATVVATLITSDTSLVVPPGIFAVGERYAFQITASNTPNTEAPFRRRFPEAACTLASGMMTVAGGSGGGMGTADAGISPDG